MSEPHPVYGNYEDKYNTKNIISKFLVGGFFDAFDSILRSLPSREIGTVCEVGCAEGELLKHLHAAFPKARLAATDLSKGEIEKAKRNCAHIPVDFSVQNAENLDAYADLSFDLVVCCEVLEHLLDPTLGLQELSRISKKYVLVSVPREPIWRVLNLLRGKYIENWGNTPGHLNHWTVLQFPRILRSESFTISKQKYPLPWQMTLLEKKRA